ncbi:hypothetical protein [Leptospira kirschneri]|uniref:Uncharacterized protein n=2 Tax=Leptospira kirschneri TaxID=29507 RepID=A0A0E2B7V0_9LEPT|nr:hypothetical protein [Leptospira kirschneri]EKO17399.1 hypothetical protein LEP1GSC081_0618 [Leptospira kirschneri str. H1]EKO61820.1 hypothetical protein LEP1GSC082_0725 [Leptospira kirschneri str. H2]EMK25077.1 hypothetical protein LEP1GSC008_1522 [Leptospira kirschneri serovar Bulgarica str. Nikolaevo]UML81307.1 hypothetical protein FH602_06685 [Leptospira kirschneri]
MSTNSRYISEDLRSIDSTDFYYDFISKINFSINPQTNTDFTICGRDQGGVNKLIEKKFL